MKRVDQAAKIVDRLRRDAKDSPYSYVAIKAGTVAKILQKETGSLHHQVPTCCNALKSRFREGQDFFRRGKERVEWSTAINGRKTSTFEVLFEIDR